MITDYRLGGNFTICWGFTPFLNGSVWLALICSFIKMLWKQPPSMGRVHQLFLIGKDSDLEKLDHQSKTIGWRFGSLLAIHGGCGEGRAFPGLWGYWRKRWKYWAHVFGFSSHYAVHIWNQWTITVKMLFLWKSRQNSKAISKIGITCFISKRVSLHSQKVVFSLDLWELRETSRC